MDGTAQVTTGLVLSPTLEIDPLCPGPAFGHGQAGSCIDPHERHRTVVFLHLLLHFIVHMVSLDSTAMMDKLFIVLKVHIALTIFTVLGRKLYLNFCHCPS